MSFLCACSSRFGSMGPERRKKGPGGGIPDSFGSSGGRIRRRGMAESQMDIMDRSNLFLLKKAEKNSISCVDKDDKTIFCQSYERLRKSGKNVFDLWGKCRYNGSYKRILPCFYSNTERLGDEVCLMR